jgi:hypothetical protein
LVDHNVTTTTNKYKTFAEWLDIGLMEGDLDDVLTRMYANMKQEERTRLLTEILTIIPTSFRYVGDHVILPNGKRIPVEDFDSPFETRTGDCVADYEEIYTLNGVKTVADIVVGDLVLSYDFAD